MKTDDLIKVLGADAKEPPLPQRRDRKSVV